MLCCPQQQIEPPTEEARKHVKRLRTLMIVQIIVAILKFFVLIQFGLFELLAAFLLYLAYIQINHCNCIMYIFLCIMNTVQIFVYFGEMAQNRIQYKSEGVVNTFQLLTFIYYIVAIYLVFIAYREFKAIQYSNLGTEQQIGLPVYRADSFPAPGGQRANFQSYDANTRQNQPQFTGKGIVVGGGGRPQNNV